MTKSGAIVLLLLASACIPGNGPMMAPFQDCLGCHSSAGSAKSWTVAGTWAKGATITVTDATGRCPRGNTYTTYLGSSTPGSWSTAS